ncbi:glycosyl hydrolase family 95 catalytic domain-containing protein [Terriglobus albidus]|uniref:glycosyl hydrolase family 95 catalytic domain-containing protein n=1 Tax=Terriglobus albidus TaxID=1592106 RepID=UPI0021E0D3DD|nr:hypothetical protein [Terriglobus albidus]
MRSLVIKISFNSCLIAATIATTSMVGQSLDRNKDWNKVQSLLAPIQGIAEAPPADVVTSKLTAGAIMGNGDIGVVAGGTESEPRFYFGKSDFWGSYSNKPRHRQEISILSLGSLSLSFKAAGGQCATKYRMAQDILHAQVTTNLTLNGTPIHIRSFTADDSNTFLVEVQTDKGSPSVSLALALVLPKPDADEPDRYPGTAGADHNDLWVTRQNDLKGPDAYTSRVAIGVRTIGSTPRNATHTAGQATEEITLKGGAPVWIVTTFESDSRMGPSGPTVDGLVKKALTRADQISPAGIQQAEARHEEWWKQFWLKSFIDVHDETLHDYYYGALYVLGSTNRPGKLATSMFGSFITTDQAAWGARYFMNYNAEAPYYGVFSSNRAELAEPYNEMVIAQVPWQTNRTALAGYKGVSFQRTFTPFNNFQPAPALVPIAPVKDYKKLPADQKSNATFSVLPLISYYEYTGDTHFLREKLYPILKGLDAFWRDFAVRDENGKWSFVHSAAHEGGDDVDPNLDIGFARRIAEELIETSKVLNVDAELRPIWQAFIDNLAPYPSGEVNGKQVYYIAKSIKNDITDHGLFEPGNQPINLEGLVYPGENLAIGGDAVQLQIAKNSMEEMNSWGVTRGGNSFNGFCKIFVVAARIGWPADDLVNKFRAAILHQWRPSNLSVAQGGGGIETSGSIEALNSMLLQHELGVLRVFPDWPATMDASFTRLRAKGGYLVTSAQSKGSVLNIDFTSEHGGRLTVQSPWGSRPVAVTTIGSGLIQTLSPGMNGQFTMDTRQGTSYRITPK